MFVVLPFFQKYGVNVSFEMIHTNERFFEGKRQRLGVAEADQQCAGKTRPFRHSKSVEALVSLVGIFQRFADNRNDGAEMFTRRQFWHDSAVGLMSGDLRIDNIRDDFFAGAHHGRGSLVA